ncbi:EpsG family protein [bacterium]|nr:EpsG family protein [bacterium]
MLYVVINSTLFLLRISLSRQRILRDYIFYITIAFLFLFSAFRYEVGCDWSGYLIQYSNPFFRDWSELSIAFEPIWWAILLGVNEMNWPYPTLNIISSAVFFVGILLLARRQPDPLGFLVFLFPILIINMPMSGIRQGAAIGLICIAFIAFIDRRPLWFSFWVLLAVGFHASAIVFFTLLPFSTARFSIKRFMFATILAIPGLILVFMMSAAQQAISRYIGTGNEAAGAIYRVGLIGLSGLYFLLFMRKKWQIAWPRDYSLAVINAFGMMLVFVVLLFSSVIADRFAYYLVPIQAMFFARLPFLPFRSNWALHVILPYIGLLLIFVVWTQTSWHFEKCYMPYKSWIFGFPDG